MHHCYSNHRHSHPWSTSSLLGVREMDGKREIHILKSHCVQSRVGGATLGGGGLEVVWHRCVLDQALRGGLLPISGLLKAFSKIW